ncbi:MAG: hypothetical protein ABI824_11115 [Acidobacteriota bacterium]
MNVRAIVLALVGCGAVVFGQGRIDNGPDMEDRLLGHWESLSYGGALLKSVFKDYDVLTFDRRARREL